MDRPNSKPVQARLLAFVLAVILTGYACNRSAGINPTPEPPEENNPSTPVPAAPEAKDENRDIPGGEGAPDWGKPALDGSFLGITSIDSAPFFQPAAGLGMDWVSAQPRVLWQDVERYPGVFDWKGLDESILALQNTGMDATMVLLPARATDEQMAKIKERIRSEKLADYLRLKDAAGMSLYPDSGEEIKEWRQFVQTLVERYDADGTQDAPGLRRAVTHWQVLDEYPSIWLPDVQAYLTILQATTLEIKREMPTAVVILAGMESRFAQMAAFSEGALTDDEAGVVNGTRLSRAQIAMIKDLRTQKNDLDFLLKEGRGYYDVVDVHYYEPKTTFLEGKTAWMRAALARAGAAVPIWALEAGGPFKLRSGQRSEYGDLYYGKYTDEENAQFAVKLPVLAALNGITRFSWNFVEHGGGNPLNGPWNNMGLLRSSGAPKPSYYAYGMVRDFLQGYTDVTDLSSGTIRLYEFFTPAGMRYVAWLDKESKENTTSMVRVLPGMRVRIQKTVTALDGMGNALIPEEEIVEAYAVPLSLTPLLIDAAP